MFLFSSNDGNTITLRDDSAIDRLEFEESDMDPNHLSLLIASAWTHKVKRRAGSVRVFIRSFTALK